MTCQVCCQTFQLFAGGIIGKADGKTPQAACAAITVLNILGGNLRVFYRNNNIIRGTYPCRAEGDILDGSFIVSENHIIPNTKRMLQHKRDAGNQVGQCGLRSQ